MQNLMSEMRSCSVTSFFAPIARRVGKVIFHSCSSCALVNLFERPLKSEGSKKITWSIYLRGHYQENELPILREQQEKKRLI